MSRVYWHGLFPDPAKTGRIVRRGSIRHEVQWDHNPAGETTLVWTHSLMLVGRFGRCCPYCKKESA